MAWAREAEAEGARPAASSVHGWLSDSRGRALFEAAAQMTGRGFIVEIGSWPGRSTIWLAAGARVRGEGSTRSTLLRVARGCRRAARRSKQAAESGWLAGLLLYLFDVKRALKRRRWTPGSSHG